MAKEPWLDRSRPFITVFGDHEYAFKQDNQCFDALGKFLKYEGAAPKAEAEDVGEEALREKIRTEVQAEVAETHRAKVRAGIEAARAAKEAQAAKKTEHKKPEAG